MRSAHILRKLARNVGGFFSSGDENELFSWNCVFYSSGGEKWEPSTCQFTQQGHLQGQMGDDEGV